MLACLDLPAVSCQLELPAGCTCQELAPLAMTSSNIAYAGPTRICGRPSGSQGIWALLLFLSSVSSVLPANGHEHFFHRSALAGLP
jgi:hypothetical protein